MEDWKLRRQAKRENRIRRRLKYDPLTGAVRNPRGKIVGTNDKEGYLVISVLGKSLYLHRVIWFLQTGEWPSCGIDHINRNKHDNRWENLRLATVSENGLNRKIGSNNTSGVIGVSWNSRDSSWVAKFRWKHLGSFHTKDQAIEARDRAFKDWENAQLPALDKGVL
jgi:hypothetical protein